jgi:hypothetical protein
MCRRQVGFGTAFSTFHVSRRTLHHEIQYVEQTLRDLDVTLGRLRSRRIHALVQLASDEVSCSPDPSMRPVP